MFDIDEWQRLVDEKNRLRNDEDKINNRLKEISNSIIEECQRLFKILLESEFGDSIVLSQKHSCRCSIGIRNTDLFLKTRFALWSKRDNKHYAIFEDDKTGDLLFVIRPTGKTKRNCIPGTRCDTNLIAKLFEQLEEQLGCKIETNKYYW